jgi:hypothetical protein
MKKLTKLLATTMTAGLLLAACGDNGDVNDPATEDPANDTEGLEDLEDFDDEDVDE